MTGGDSRLRLSRDPERSEGEGFRNQIECNLSGNRQRR
jgi:hypothetical protein